MKFLNIKFSNSNKDTSGAKDLIEKIKSNGGAIPSGMSREMVWDAKYVYDSAYHPTTGDLVFMPGRMSFQEIYLNCFSKLKSDEDFFSMLISLEA